MANPYINKVVLGNETLLDLTADTVTPQTLYLGTTAHDASGAAIVGTLDTSIGSVYQDADGFLVVDDSESSAPQGNISITSNGTYDVADYAGASVDVGDAEEIRIYVGIDGTYGYDFTVKIDQTVTGTAAVDWGDGTPEEVADSSVGTVPLTHTYAATGLYKVRLYAKNGGSFGLSQNSIGAYTSKDYKVVGVEVNAIGTSTVLATGALRSLMNCSYVKIGSGITGISTRTVSENNARILYIPDTVNSITGSYQFGPNPSLEFIRIDTPLTEIYEAMFYQCSSLKTIQLTDCNPTKIGSYAFRSCESLKAISIPASVSSIGVYSFANCTSLKDIHVLPQTPPTLGNDAFVSPGSSFFPSDFTIYVPSESLEAYQTAENWSDYASYMVGE